MRQGSSSNLRLSGPAWQAFLRTVSEQLRAEGVPEGIRGEGWTIFNHEYQKIPANPPPKAEIMMVEVVVSVNLATTL